MSANDAVHSEILEAPARGVYAWVEANMEKLPIYGIKLTKTTETVSGYVKIVETASGFIEAVDGVEYEVGYSRENGAKDSDKMIYVRLFVDGREFTYGGNVEPGEGSETSSSFFGRETLTQHQACSLQFCALDKIDTYEDDGLDAKAAAPDKLGSIVIDFSHTTGQPQVAEPTEISEEVWKVMKLPKDVKEELVRKGAITHLTIPGTLEACELDLSIPAEDTPLAYQFATFEFKYRSRAWLEAQGLVAANAATPTPGPKAEDEDEEAQADDLKPEVEDAKPPQMSDKGAKRDALKRKQERIAKENARIEAQLRRLDAEDSDLEEEEVDSDKERWEKADKMVLEDD